MSELADKFSRRSNDNLLQLWRGRDKLKDYDIDPLRDELEKRGLSKQAEEIAEQVSGDDPYGKLPPAPQTYLNLSVPFWWLRELWLRHRTKGGTPVEATIEHIQRTRASFRSAARVEVLYTYDFQGEKYSGRVVRDFVFGSTTADSLAYDHHPGEKLPIVIARDHPENSYYPSGFGFIQPLMFGIQSLFAWAVVIGIVRLFLLLVLRKI